MKKKAEYYFIIFLCFSIYFECNRALLYRLNGKWIADDQLAAVTMEFCKDGIVTVRYKEGVELKGTWKIDPHDTIRIEMEFWQIQAFFDGNKLVLKNNTSEKVYKKIK